MTDVDNHMTQRDEQPCVRNLEARLIDMTRTVGFLQYAQGQIADLKLEPDLLKAVNKSLNAALTRLMDIEEECEKHPDFKLRPEPFDYFDFAVEILKGHSA